MTISIRGEYIIGIFKLDIASFPSTQLPLEETIRTAPNNLNTSTTTQHSLSLNEDEIQIRQYRSLYNPAPSYGLPSYDEFLQAEYNPYTNSLSEHALPSYEEAIRSI